MINDVDQTTLICLNINQECCLCYRPHSILTTSV